MPVPDNHFAGIVMIDVLHHLQRPMDFLREACRVLRPGGRLAMIEPGMSFVSRRFYSAFHQEPVIMTADPFAEGVKQSGDDPFDSNQAIPTLMFARKSARIRIEAAIPGLSVRNVEWLSLIAYPLSGGFKKWLACPASLVPAVLAVEKALLPAAGPLAAFRLMIVLEKKSA